MKENYVLNYTRINRETNVIIVSGITPNLSNPAELLNVVIPRNLGPSTVIGIGSHLLKSEIFAMRIKSIEFPDTIRSIGPYSFFGAGIKKLVLPAAVNEIGDSAFSCSEVEEVIFQGDNLRELDSAVFCSCESLKSISLPKELRYIGEYCFNRCLGLKEITIPSKIIRIGMKAFTGSGLKTVIFEGPVPLQVHPEAFSSKTNMTAYVKKEYLESYKNSDRINKFFKDILPLESRQLELECKGGKAIVLPKLGENNENMYTGELDIPESIYIGGIKRKIIGIDQFAFFDCSLRKIVIPKNLDIENIIFDSNIEIERK